MSYVRFEGNPLDQLELQRPVRIQSVQDARVIAGALRLAATVAQELCDQNPRDLHQWHARDVASTALALHDELQRAIDETHLAWLDKHNPKEAARLRQTSLETS